MKGFVCLRDVARRISLRADKIQELVFAARFPLPTLSAEGTVWWTEAALAEWKAKPWPERKPLYQREPRRRPSSVDGSWLGDPGPSPFAASPLPPLGPSPFSTPSLPAARPTQAATPPTPAAEPLEIVAASSLPVAAPAARAKPARLVTIAVMCQRYGVTPRTIHIWIKRGIITPALRTPGGHWRFHPPAPIAPVPDAVAPGVPPARIVD